MLTLTVNEATLDQLREHLMLCDTDFMPPLSETVDIAAYAQKLFLRATRFEAQNEDGLIAVVAAYFDPLKRTAFITSVSVDPGHRGQGLASRLIECAIHEARRSGCRSLGLEVSSSNAAAAALYRSLGFMPSGERGSTTAMQLPIETENPHV